jgi:hypothetical protein
MMQTLIVSVAKALIKAEIILKDDIILELKIHKAAVKHQEMLIEIDRMIRAVESW